MPEMAHARNPVHLPVERSRCRAAVSFNSEMRPPKPGVEAEVREIWRLADALSRFVA